MVDTHADRANESGPTNSPVQEFYPKQSGSTQLYLSNLFEKLGADPVKNINTIIGFASDISKTTLAYYYRFDGSGEIMCACSNQSVDADFQGTLPLKKALCHETFLNNGNQPVVIENLQSSPIGESDPSIEQAGFTSFLGFPVRNHEKNVGELGLIDKNKRTYTPEDVQAVALLARALAIEEGRLQKESELQRRVELEQMLKRISTGAIQSDNEETFIMESLSDLGQVLEISGTFIWELRPGDETIGLKYEWMSDDSPQYEIDLTQIPADTIKWGLQQLSAGNILNYADVDDMPDGQEKEIARALSLTSLLVVPIFIENEFFGFIGFEDRIKKRHWSEQDISILRTVADIVSKTIENERLKIQLKLSTRRTNEELSKTKEELEAEIREHKKDIRRLKSIEETIARKNSRLQDMNNALSVMFRKRNEDIEQIEKQMAHNIRDLIDPTMQRLKCSNLKPSQKKWLDVLEANLNDIASPLAAKLANGYQKLTPTEIKIASFIKHGNTNKEIARLLSISNRTVEVHRCNIRRKLGIKNRDMNLRTYLLSME